MLHSLSIPSAAGAQKTGSRAENLLGAGTGKAQAAAWFLQFSPSWVEKEKQAVVGLADSKQGRLCPWSMLHWRFALEGFNYFLLSVGILSRVLPVRSFPHVCSFLVSEKMELLEIVSRLVWSNIGVATGFMHILSWQGRKFHITEVPMTESKTIAEHSNLAWVALPSYLQVSD